MRRHARSADEVRERFSRVPPANPDPIQLTVARILELVVTPQRSTARGSERRSLKALWTANVTSWLESRATPPFAEWAGAHLHRWQHVRMPLVQMRWAKAESGYLLRRTHRDAKFKSLRS